MKNKFLLIAAAVAVIVSTALAVLPTFLSKTASGTASATAIFPHDPNSQIRVVSIISSSDLASSTVTALLGSTATYLVATNATSSTNLYVASTNGFAVGNQVYVNGATSNVVAQVTSLINATNVGLSAALGIVGPLNAEVEVLTTNAVLGVGAKTNNVYGSDGLIVGNYGRALILKQTGTGYSSIDSATVHYDSVGN